MKKIILIIILLVGKIGYSQTLNDTLSHLKSYSHTYLELLFNKRDIDSAMLFWDKGIFDDLKVNYTNHKQECNTDSMLRVLFTNDINNFCSHIKGKIDFFTCDDKEGVNIKYFPFPNDPYIFFIQYDFYGDFESHNLLMRTALNFQSSDKGRTWHLVQDNWISNYMVINYFKKDYYGKPSSH